MPECGRAVVLIGFSGSGKSSVGRELERMTKLPRYDTDEMVRAKIGLPIGRIFEERGEEVFRAAETEALREVPAGEAIVVTGGGIVLREENVTMLRQLGTIVHLTADEETLFARVSRRPTRPLLRTADPRWTLSELLRVRQPLYERLADLVIDTSSMTHAEVAAAILGKLNDIARA